MSDTIYRDDVIKRIISASNKTYNAIKQYRTELTMDYLHGLDDAIQIIKDAPSADIPQGEWVDAEIPLESGDTMPIQVCNLCKTFYPLAYTGGGHRFCPNCGARMKGAENNKECHKPQSLYYRAFCEERKDSAYCDGCGFWY